MRSEPRSENVIFIAYEALYCVFRPRTFGEVSGQEHITDVLKKQISTGQTSHAYLFCGPRGTGKTSTAKILANALNCLNPQDGNPCGECEVCRSVRSESFVDIVEIDAASHNGVDDIRDIREKVSLLPVAGRFKVYIIDERRASTTRCSGRWRNRPRMWCSFWRPPNRACSLRRSSPAASGMISSGFSRNTSSRG